MSRDIVERQESALSGDSWFVADRKGLKATRQPTFDEWHNTGEKLGQLHHSLPMMLGDWMNLGENAFGERYTQALDIFGEYDYHTVANYASVMRKVPYERRVEGLTYSHYKAVASLEEPDAQVEAQHKAKENSWTSKELWEYTHEDDVRKLPQLIDEVSRGIGLLYQLTTSARQDSHLDEANRHLMLAKEDYEERDRGL